MTNIIKPLVSIVVVTYNHKEFITECLDAIIAQDYPNKEIIIADDFSSDGARSICEQYQQNYPDMIKLVPSDKNVGITNNCNNGLKLCNGSLLCLTGGDDIFLPGKLSAQVSWFLQNPTGSICTSDIEVFESTTNKTISIYRNKGFAKGGPITRIIRQKNNPPSSNFMLNWILCGDLKFDERTPIVSDWLFYSEACMRGKIGYLKEVYLRYRRHSQNMTAGGSDKSHLEDRLIYTDLFLSKYPKYFRSCKIQRANIFFEVAKREFFIKNYKMSRTRAYSGIREYAFDFRNWLIILATFMGNVAYNFARKYKNS